MQFSAILAVMMTLMVSTTFAAPVVAPDAQAIKERDGSREFDTDLCVLKARAAAAAAGIDKRMVRGVGDEEKTCKKPDQKEEGPAVKGRNEKRDGWREFDTDLCVLKKRMAEEAVARRDWVGLRDVLGVGIDNCDM